MVMYSMHSFLILCGEALDTCSNMTMLYHKLQTEVYFLGALHHPNLVKLLGYCAEDCHRLLVYEYVSRGSLENHLFSSKFVF